MNRLSILVKFVATLTNVDVGFFADSDLGEKTFDVASLHESFKSEIVVALVS